MGNSLVAIQVLEGIIRKNLSISGSSGLTIVAIIVTKVIVNVQLAR